MARGRTSDRSRFQQACIDVANRLLKLLGQSSQRISSVSDIKSEFIVFLFEKITGSTISDLLPGKEITAEVHNVQAVIDTLSLDLLGLSLSHISGEDVISGDPLAILNLLEVLEAVCLQLSPHNEQCHKNTKSKRRKVYTSFRSESSSQFLDSDDAFPKNLKRKTCKRTVNNFLQDEVKKSPISELECQYKDLLSLKQNNVDSERDKKKFSEEKSDSSEHYRTNVEQLYDSNFEKQVMNALFSDKSPYVKCQQLKQNYLQNMKRSIKKKSFPVCKKSFLLPHNLRNLPTNKKQAKSKKQNTLFKIQQENLRTCECKDKSKISSDLPAVIKYLLEEFPGFEFHSNTLELMKKKYYQHINLLRKQLKNALLKKPLTLKQAEEAEAKQIFLSKILTKDMKLKQHLKELKEQKTFENHIRYSLRDSRIQSAKIKQYFNEFHSSVHKKMQQRNFTEELIVEKTFQDMLNLQKEKIHLLCHQANEADKQDAKRHRQYLQALQHTYEQQLDLITKSLVTQQKETFENCKQKNLIIRKLNRELRDKLQTDVRILQNDVLELMKDTHFRELDAQNFLESLNK